MAGFVRTSLRQADRVRRHLKTGARGLYLSMRGPRTDRVLVDIGGGHTFNPGWRTLDFDPGVRGYRSAFITYPHDLRSPAPLPFSDGEVDIFYTSHTMEHLPPQVLQRVLRECHRALKPGGGMRIVVPDFEKARIAYETDDNQWFDHWQAKSRRKYRNNPAVEAMTGRKRLVYQLVYYIAGHCIGIPDLDRKFDEIGNIYRFADYVVSLIGNEVPVTEGSFGFHANWFNGPKLAGLLREAGFSRIVINNPFESIFDELRPRHHLFTHWLTPVGFDASYPHISITADAVK